MRFRVDLAISALERARNTTQEVLWAFLRIIEVAAQQDKLIFSQRGYW